MSHADPPATAHLVLYGEELPAGPAGSLLAALRSAGARLGAPVRPAHPACQVLDVAFEGLPAGEARRLIRELRAQEPGGSFDAAVVPASLRDGGRVLLVMDVDSTFIQEEVIELLAAHAGREAQVRAATEAAMRGEVDFATSLRSRVSELAGVPQSAFGQVRQRVRFTPGALRLVRRLLDGGDEVLLVSGGFTEVVAGLAKHAGISHFRANSLELADGKLTGRVLGEVIDREAKARAARQVARAARIPPDHVIAVGDGANDLDMMAQAALGVAFNAKPLVRAEADAAISVPWLDLVLSLLGREDASAGPEGAHA